MSLGQRYTDEDRKMLRAAGINLITPLPDGSLLFPLGCGYSGNGVSVQAMTDAELERQRIHRLQRLIHDPVAEVTRALKAEGYTGNTEVVGPLNFGNGVQWVSFDGFASALLFNKVRYRAGKQAPEIDASTDVAISAVSA